MSEYDNVAVQDVHARLGRIEEKLDATYRSTEQTRKYFLWTLIITIALFVLPTIGLLFAIPSFLATYGALGDPALLDTLIQ